MAKHHKPKAGSRAYWPKKRAKRIYPAIRTRAVKSNDTSPLSFAGYKAGMSQVKCIDNTKDSPTEGEEVMKPATVIECPPLLVCGIRTYVKDHDGLKSNATIWSDKPDKDLDRRFKVPKSPDRSKTSVIDKQAEKLADVRLLVHTKPRDSGIGKKKPDVFEVGIGGEVAARWDYAKGMLGKELKVSDVFRDGEWIDVSSVTRGKGFQGPVKRFGIKVRPRKHEKKRRHTGVLGTRGVARVLPGKIAMAGQLGFQTRTEYNKRVIGIGSGELTPKGGWLRYGKIEGDYIILMGSVPGPKKRLIMMRKGIRARSHEKENLELKEVILDSQQGA
jgi:large subunit ribosomal protein L3